MTRWIAIALLMSATTAFAAPKKKDAKAAFDRGVVAYQKGDFAAASEALGQSYKLEPDLETLFAWAQSERQQDKCESALELYKKLLALDMPTENRAAVQANVDECKAIVAAKTGVLDKPDKPIEPPKKDEPPKKEEPPPVIDKPEKPSGPTPWWKDPIGDALTISGVIGIGVGTYFLIASKSAADDSMKSHADFEKKQDDAESKGKIGIIVGGVGAALVVGGIVRYVTRSSGKKEETNVTGWITNDAGGVAAFGRF